MYIRELKCVLANPEFVGIVTELHSKTLEDILNNIETATDAKLEVIKMLVDRLIELKVLL